jgi:hypothetical protein
MQDSPQEFEKLRQLLALKRQENPPPGYFRDFSSRVVNQLERDKVRASEGWFQRLTALFQARPAISWSFCMATGLVLVAATTLFEGNPGGPAAAMPSVEPTFASMPDQSVPASAAGVVFETNFQSAGFALEMAPARTNLGPSDSLFSSPLYNLQVEPASFSR